MPKGNKTAGATASSHEQEEAAAVIPAAGSTELPKDSKGYNHLPGHDPDAAPPVHQYSELERDAPAAIPSVDSVASGVTAAASTGNKILVTNPEYDKVGSGSDDESQESSDSNLYDEPGPGTDSDDEETGSSGSHQYDELRDTEIPRPDQSSDSNLYDEPCPGTDSDDEETGSSSSHQYDEPRDTGIPRPDHGETIIYTPTENPVSTASSKPASSHYEVEDEDDEALPIAAGGSSAGTHNPPGSHYDVADGDDEDFANTPAARTIPPAEQYTPYAISDPSSMGNTPISQPKKKKKPGRHVAFNTSVNPVTTVSKTSPTPWRSALTTADTIVTVNDPENGDEATEHSPLLRGLPMPETLSGLSCSQHSASRADIGLSHWLYLFFRHGLSLITIASLVFIIVEFAKAWITEDTLVLQDPENPLNFFLLNVLAMPDNHPLFNAALTLFAEPFREYQGFQLAPGVDPTQVFCGSYSAIAVPFSGLIKQQTIAAQITYSGGGVNPCWTPEKSEAGLVNLDITTAGSHDIDLQRLSFAFWTLATLGLTFLFANRENVINHAGLVQFARGIVWLPVDIVRAILGILSQGSFRLSLLVKGENWTRRNAIRLNHGLNTFSVGVSNQVGGNATVLRLAQDNGVVERIFGLDVPYEAQAIVLERLGLFLSTGAVFTQDGTTLMHPLRVLDETLNQSARIAGLRESSVFGNFLGGPTFDRIEKYTAALRRVFLNEHPPVPAEQGNTLSYKDTLWQNIQRIETSIRETQAVENTSVNHTLICSYRFALQHLSDDVHDRFWHQRLKHLIIKHLEHWHPRQIPNEPAGETRSRRVLLDFKTHLIENFPGLFAILVHERYYNALRALGVPENENCGFLPERFRREAAWKGYFSQIAEETKTLAQDEAAEEACRELRYLYLGPVPGVVADNGGVLVNPVYQALPVQQNRGPLPAPPSLDVPEDRYYDEIDTQTRSGMDNPAYVPSDLSSRTPLVNPAYGSNPGAGFTCLTSFSTPASPDSVRASTLPTLGRGQRMFYGTGVGASVRSVEEVVESDNDLSGSDSDSGARTFFHHSTKTSNELPQFVGPKSTQSHQGLNWDEDGSESEDEASDTESAAAAATSTTPASRELRRTPAAGGGSSLLRKKTNLADLFSKENIRRLHVLATDKESDDASVKKLRHDGIHTQAQHYKSDDIDALHTKLQQEYKPLTTEPTPKMWTIGLALCHYYLQHSDAGEAEAAQKIIKSYTQDLQTKIPPPSAQVLEKDLLGIYYLLLNPDITQEQREQTIHALEMLMNYQRGLQNKGERNKSWRGKGIYTHFKSPKPAAAATPEIGPAHLPENPTRTRTSNA